MSQIKLALITSQNPQTAHLSGHTRANLFNDWCYSSRSLLQSRFWARLSF